MFIIFDLDDTLIDSVRCLGQVKLRAALKNMIDQGLVLPFSFEQAFAHLIKIDQTSLSGDETFRKFLKEINAPISFVEMGKKVYYEYFEDGMKVDCVPYAIDVVSNLAKNHTLAIVTCGYEQQQHQKMKKAGLLTKYFSEIIVLPILSNKKIHYESLLAKYKYTPKQTIVCGDRFASDLAPAKELGIKTIHFRWGRGRCPLEPNQKPDYSIDSLAQVLPLIEKLQCQA